MRLVILNPHGEETTQFTVTGSRDHWSEIKENPICGNCGACLIKTDKPEAFQPPSEREQQALRSVNAKPNERLACVSLLNVEATGSVRIWNAYVVYNPIRR